MNILSTKWQTVVLAKIILSEEDKGLTGNVSVLKGVNIISVSVTCP